LLQHPTPYSLRVRLFVSPVGSALYNVIHNVDPTGYGEGQALLVALDSITTNASGHIGFSFQTPNTIGANQRLTAGAKVLIGGFIINGSQSKSILVRALGPTLAQAPFNLSGVLGDPTLALYQGATQLAANDNWAETQQSEINATGKAPPNAAESAILQPLAPNAYTAILSGKNATTGIGLVGGLRSDARQQFYSRQH
jgi:hypothetical protein